MTSPSVDPSAILTTPSVTAPNVNPPGLAFAPLSIVRDGNGFSLSGDLPDLNVKTSLLDSLRGAFGPDIRLTDNLTVKAGVSAPDFSGIGALFKAAIDIPDWPTDKSLEHGDA